MYRPDYDYHSSNSEHWKNYGAKYTMKVADLVKNNFVFNLQSYPIWDESYRTWLNNMIINHYMMREIGFETEGLFNLMLGAKMNEVMPWLNNIIEGMMAQYDRLKDHDYTEEYEDSYTETVDRDMTNDTDLDHSDRDLDLHSDTPQNDVGNMVTESPDGLFVHYLTDAQLHTNSGNVSGRKDDVKEDRQEDSAKEYTKTNTGMKVPPALLYKYLQDTAQPVFTMLFNELDVLFLGLWR